MGSPTGSLAPSPALTGEALAGAAGALAAAERELAELAVVTTAPEPSYAVLERLGSRLGTLAHEQSCPDRLRNLLLDWRSRLSSHLLAARTLQEVQAAPHLPLHMVRRGVTDISDELAALAKG